MKKNTNFAWAFKISHNCGTLSTMKIEWINKRKCRMGKVVTFGMQQNFSHDAIYEHRYTD